MLCDQMVFPRFALSLKTAQGGSTHLNFKTIWNVGLTQCFPTFKGYRAPPIQTEVYFLILKLYSTFSLTMGPVFTFVSTSISGEPKMLIELFKNTFKALLTSLAAQREG